MEATKEPAYSTSAPRDRKTYLGGPDVAAIAGLHPHRTRLQVFLAKTGRAVDERKPVMEWGLRLEDDVLDAYLAQIGDPRIRVTPGAFVAGPETFLGGTPDFLLDAPEAPAHRILEAKTVWTRNPRLLAAWGETGTEEIPQEHLAQVTYYLGLTGREAADVAALLPGCDFRVYRIGFDREFFDLLVDGAVEFWRTCIETDTPPAVDLDGSDEAGEYLRARWPSNVRPLRRATEEEAVLAIQLQAAGRMFDEAEQAWDQAAQMLQEKIADADGIEGPGFKITYKAPKASTVTDWEAVARALAPGGQIPEEIVGKHSVPKKVSRRFLPTFEYEEEQA